MSVGQQDKQISTLGLFLGERLKVKRIVKTIACFVSGIQWQEMSLLLSKVVL